MKRGFKAMVVANAGTPQPLIGTTISAAIPAGATQVKVQVADSSMFLQGDWAVLIEANGTLRERVFIAVVPDSTHVTFKLVNNAHASGAFLQLAGACADVFVQSLDGSIGTFYIGTDITMVKATFAKVIAKILPVNAGIQPDSFSTKTAGNMNADDISNFWIDADNNTDTYLPSISVI